MYILKRFSLLSVIFIFLLYKVKEIEHEKQVSHQANPARRSQVLYKLDWQPDHTTRTNLYKRLNHVDDHKVVFTADELNSTDLHQVDPVTRLVIGHARQRRHFIGCSAAVRELQFSSVQFVRCEHGLIHLKAATHEQTPTADTAISVGSPGTRADGSRRHLSDPLGSCRAVVLPGKKDKRHHPTLLAVKVTRQPSRKSNKRDNVIYLFLFVYFLIA